MFNVLNFLNEEWGKREFVSFNNYRIWTIEQYVDQEYANANGLSAEDIGKPVINFDPADAYDSEIFQTSDVGSRWQLQIGVRYSF